MKELQNMHLFLGPLAWLQTQKDRQTGRQKDGQKNHQTDRRTQADKHTQARQAGTTGRHGRKARQAGMTGGNDRQADRQIGRQADSKKTDK
jgi:hypothetical protein